MPLPTSLVVKNGSKMRATFSAAIPAPVSPTPSVTNGVDRPAWPRIAGFSLPQDRVRVSVPSPSIASRAFTARLTMAVSNWLASACTKQGHSGLVVTTRMRAPVRVSSIVARPTRREPTSKVSGLSGCRRAKARSCPVSFAARSTVLDTASM